MKTLHLYFDEDEDSFEADLDESRWLDSLVEDNQWEAPVPDKIITIETMGDIPALASHLTHLFDKRLRYEVVFDTEGRDSAPNKCGWAWWIYDDDDTSYIKEDLTVEWYGHSPPEEPA